MKVMYTIVLAAAGLAMLWSPSYIEAQWEDNQGEAEPAPEKEAGKKKPRKQPAGKRAPRGNVGRLKQRLKRISPKLFKAADELGACNNRKRSRLLNAFTRQTGALSKMKKSDPESFNRNIEIMILELQALPLVETVLNGPDEQAGKEAKAGLLENLGKKLDLEKEDLEARIKKIQSKLEKYNTQRDEVLNSSLEKLLNPEPSKKGRPKRARKPKKA